MITADQGQRDAASAREEFVRKALAEVEKAHKVQRIKQLIVTGLAFAAALWLVGFKGPSRELQIECTIIIVLGLALAVCTAKILSAIARNTKAILQAIADLHTRSF